MVSLLVFEGCSNDVKSKAADNKSNINQEAQISSSNIQYYFTRANEHPDVQLIKVINSAKSTLDIAIYSITKKEIVDAIINAKNRGVTVRLMTDKIESSSKSEAKELKLLKDKKIPIKVNSHSGLLHIKTTIADKSVATTGSYNYTENASIQNDEVLLIIKDSKVATDFSDEFQRMWQDKNDYIDYN